MGYLEKKFILHERDEKGKLIPIDYPVPELGGQMVKILPLTRGELQSFAEKRQSVLQKRIQEQLDIAEGKKGTKGNKEIPLKPLSRQEKTITEELVVAHILEPKFTVEELRNAKLIKVGDEHRDLLVILMDAIYTISGVESTVNKEEEQIKKN